MQVAAVARSLARVCRVSVREALGGGGSTAMRRRSLRKSLEDGITDVLVATPGMLGRMREEGLVLLSELEVLVVDEVDVTMAAQGFEEQMAPVWRAIEKKGKCVPPQREVQCVYVGASMPGNVKWRIEKRHDERDDLCVAQSDDMHVATPAKFVPTKFIRVSGGAEAKLERAAEAVKQIVLKKGSQGKVMVFCDRGNRREELVKRLEAALPVGMGVVHMAAKQTNGDRYDRWRDWKAFNESDGDVRVAICAQSFSRGIDLPALRHVVMVDVPMTGSEYMHRVGRIRVGSGGVSSDAEASVTVMVSQRDRAIAEALFLAHVRDESLATLNAPGAWRSYMDASRDRVAGDAVVATARRNKHAFWIDERESVTNSGPSGVVRRERGPMSGGRSAGGYERGGKRQFGNDEREGSRGGASRHTYGRNREEAEFRSDGRQHEGQILVRPRRQSDGKWFGSNSGRGAGEDEFRDRSQREPFRSDRSRDETGGNREPRWRKSRSDDDSNHSYGRVRRPRSQDSYGSSDSRSNYRGGGASSSSSSRFSKPELSSWRDLKAQQQGGGMGPSSSGQRRKPFTKREMRYDKRRVSDSGPYSGRS